MPHRKKAVPSTQNISKMFLVCYLLLAFITIGGLATSLVLSKDLIANIDNFTNADKTLNYKLKRLFHMGRLISSSTFEVLSSEKDQSIVDKIENADIDFQMYLEISNQLTEALNQDGLTDGDGLKEALAATNLAAKAAHQKVMEILNRSKQRQTMVLNASKEINPYLINATTRIQNLQEAILSYQDNLILKHEQKTAELRTTEIGSAVLLMLVACVISVVGYVIWKKQKVQDEIISKQKAILISSSKMSALGEMAGGIAHEINSPLAAITMRARHIKTLLSSQEPINTAKIIEYTEVIEKTGHRIAQIVQGMRAISRNADSDAFELMDITTVIEETLALCTEKLTKNDIKIVFEGKHQGLEVNGRQTQISQVILNLINNASDAIAQFDEKWIRIELSDSSSDVIISITDSGNGIPEDLREKIFNPFFTTKDVGKGTGLGLSVSKTIIENHHGNLSIDESSQKTKFILQLPKASKSIAA